MTKIKTVYDTHGRNVNMENEGVWVTLHGGVMQVKLRSGRAEQYKEQISAVLKKQNEIAADETLSAGEKEEKSLKLSIGLLTDYLVVDWKDTYGKDGKLIKYSKTACRKLLSDPYLKDLVLELIAEIGNIDRYRQFDNEKTEKN